MAGYGDYVKKMIDQAKVKKGREDLQDGEYVVTILGLTHERREKREALGKALWVDYVIDEGDEANGPEANKPGTKLDTPIVLEGANAHMSFSDLKQLLQELTACADEDVSKKWDELVDVVSDEGKHSNPTQPARGMKIGVKARKHVTTKGKNVGKVRFFPKWIGLGGQNSAAVAARRAELDKAEAA